MPFEGTQSASMTALDPSAELRERGDPLERSTPDPFGDFVSISRGLISPLGRPYSPVLSPMWGELTVITG